MDKPFFHLSQQRNKPCNFLSSIFRVDDIVVSTCRHGSSFEGSVPCFGVTDIVVDHLSVCGIDFNEATLVLVEVFDVELGRIVSQ